MIKNKRFIAVFLLLLLMLPNGALASTSEYGYFGTTTETEILWADQTYNDDYWRDLQVGGTGHGEVIWYSVMNGTQYEEGRSTVPGTVTAADFANGFKLVSTDGGEIYAITGTTSNPNNETVNFTNPSSGNSSSGNTSSCAACEIFSCPGWSEYMQGLEDIKNAIPPAPNWQTVAETFRDTIAPRVKADLEDLFGYAPDPPAAPSAPAIPSTPETPDLPSDLDDKGLTDPTGQEDPGLGDSTFDASDIKDEAPTIPEREDPTGGGFTILDPVAELPSQEEFEKNQPNEGTAPLPEAPKEGENTAPTPGDTTDTAPTPEDTTDTAPIPSDGEGTAPLPNESGTAPIPGDITETGPIPGADDSTAPIP